MSTPIRFKGVVDTTANIELDKYQGRIGFDTTVNRYVAYYDNTNRAVLARRDIMETFSGIRNNGAYQDSLGVERISSTGAVTGSTLKASNLPGSGVRPLVADALGVIDDQDAVMFRKTIDSPPTRSGIVDVLRALTSPPGSPSAGDRYCVAGSGSGAWSGKGGQLAEWDGSAWGFTDFSAYSIVPLWRALYDAGGVASRLFTTAASDNDLLLSVPGTAFSYGEVTMGSPVVNLSSISAQLRVAGTQVLSSRKTGWAASSGTTSRTGLSDSSDLAAVRSHLIALLNDLTTHGLIGA